MRSSTASLILAFCASMAVQAAPLASEGHAALINRDVEDNDMDLQEANLSKKRSVGGFAYHASSNLLEARHGPQAETKPATNADEFSSDSSDSSDSDSDSDAEDARPGIKGRDANASSSQYSASNPLDANDSSNSFDADDSANSFDADDSANSFDADDAANSFDADDAANSFDADDAANSFDAEDPANSFDAEDPANSLDAEGPPSPADTAAPEGSPTDTLTAAVIPDGDDAGGPPKNAAEGIFQADAGADEKSGGTDTNPAAANVANLQADTEAANNNLKTDANSEGDVLEKRDPSPKKKFRKSRKDKVKLKAKKGKKYKVKCKTKNGKTKCK